MKAITKYVIAAVVIAAVQVASAYVPLANTVRKLKAGSLRVAVVGDSIGYGQMATSVSLQGVVYGPRVTANSSGMPKANPMAYARFFTDYVKKIAKDDYGVNDANIETFYSTWGGATTKSAFAYFANDIVARRPDLLLYQVWNDTDEALRYAEATLRELWTVSPETDVILFSVGGCFGKAAVHDPLMTKYGVPYIDGYSGIDTQFGKFGTINANDYYMMADGKISGTRGYLFGNSKPHVNEEGYTWFNDLLASGFSVLMTTAASASGTCERVAPENALEDDPISATGDFCGHAAVISPASLVASELVDTTDWTATVNEVTSAPRDTADRATGDKLTAKAADVTISVSVTGRFLVIRGVSNMKISLDDGSTFVDMKDTIALTDGADDVTKTVILKATKKDAYFNEFYVYGASARTIPAVVSDHRWSVKYFARVAELHYHDWHLNNEQVIPHPLSWINIFRDESFGSALTVKDESIIGGDFAKNGTFLGWVEPDSVTWNGSERQFTVNTFDGKKIYAPGESIDIATLGRDLTLVAAYSDGPLSASCARTIKATFMMDATITGKRVALLDAPEANPMLTLPALPTKPYFVANGWKVINTDAVLAAGTQVTLTTDTEYIVDWTYDSTNLTGIATNGSSVCVNYLMRVGSVKDCFNSDSGGTKAGSYADGGNDQDGWSYSCHPASGHFFTVSATNGMVKAKLTNDPSYWEYPTFYGEVVIPVKASELGNVKVAYCYEPKDLSSASLTNQHMNLTLIAPSVDGLGTVTVRATSTNLIETGSNKYAYFQFSPVAGNDQYIKAVQLKFYDVNNQNRASNLKSTTFGKGDAFSFGAVTFGDDPVTPPQEDPGQDDPPVVAEDIWFFDTTQGVITNGDWIFAATVKSGNTLKVGACSAYPASASPLDFSKAIKDSAENTYVIGELNTVLGSGSGWYGSVSTTPAGLAVSALTLPNDGNLTKIGAAAFGRLDNCTSVTPFIPDSVTTLGRGAFYKIPVSADLRLASVDKVTPGSFENSKITSVWFGSALKEIGGAYGAGAFQNCTSMTNAWFDEGINGASFVDSECHFNGCSKLSGTLDLRGFSGLNVGRPLENAKITEVRLGAGITSLSSGFFNGCSKLSVVRFAGDAPATLGTPVFGNLSASQVITSVVETTDAQIRTNWMGRTATGKLTDTTCWSPALAGDTAYSKRLLIIEDYEPEEEEEEEKKDLGDVWVFDEDSNTITNGPWKFEVLLSGNYMTVAAHLANPAVVSKLDFSKRVTDGKKDYIIGKLNPGFNDDAAGKLIGELVLPPQGLTNIANSAFNNCTALTNIVNYLPDSVTRVGIQSFYKCPAKQELRVLGVTHFSTGGNWGAGASVSDFSELAFAQSGITRIVFGPGFKEIRDWDKAPFLNCTSLTNVTFDPATSGARFQGGRCGGFYGCSKLAGTIDLSGFSDLTYIGTVGGSGRALGGTAITKVILGEGLQKLHVNFFDQATKLKEVVFNCKPGTGGFTFVTTGSGVNNKMFGELASTQAVIAKIREADKAAWEPYAQNGVITAIDSTFSEAFSGANYAKHYLIYDGGDEPFGPVGDWVYDDAAGIVSNKLWAFNAVGVLSSLQEVGFCIRYPDTLSLLDFTTSVTDTRGLPMKILKLNTAFGSGNTSTTPAGLKVGELRLPTTVLDISTAAFSRLDNCTNVVNFLPDSVQNVYNYAFYKLPVKQPLSLQGVSSLAPNKDNAVATFGSSKITSVTFGPNFNYLRSWSNSAFNNCTELTNVTFDVATTNATFGGIRTDGFYNCTKLTGTVDLSGFSNLSYVSDYGGNANIFTGTKVEHFIVSGVCTKLGAGFFDGVATLKDVTFTGAPPTIETNVNTSDGWSTRKASRLFNYNQSTLKITTYIKNEYREAWAPYVLYKGQPVEKVPLGRGVTWKPEYVTDGINLSLRPVRVLDLHPGLILFCR